MNSIKRAKPLTIGIDATNLRRGGGITHLVELLRAAQPAAQGFERVVIWSGTPTLDALEESPWLDKRNPLGRQGKGLLQRTLWQRYRLSQAARDAGCDVLFVPGGSYAGNFQPVVTMSQNLLPFDMCELRRYGWSMLALKLMLLRLIQTRSFKKADGMIFLTKYARDVVLSVTGKLRCKICITPHGLNSRFSSAPKPQRAIVEYDDAHPYRVLYVSIVDQYKHQWHVVEAVAILRKEGFPIVLDLVGPAYLPALQRLNATIARADAERRWVHYHGAIPYTEMQAMYAEVDMSIWASTCETFGIILLEAMASGLPIACSNRQPMPEVLGETGVYFDPEQPEDIARALRELIKSPQLRTELAQASYERAQQYSWRRCADETFGFLVGVAQQYHANND
jgi:glycosyltransferase involved in cell wall biosynthesis